MIPHLSDRCSCTYTAAHKHSRVTTTSAFTLHPSLPACPEACVQHVGLQQQESLLWCLTCNGRNWRISDHWLWGQDTHLDLCYHHASGSGSKKTSNKSCKRRQHTRKRFSVLSPASAEVVTYDPFCCSCQDHCHTLHVHLPSIRNRHWHWFCTCLWLHGYNYNYRHREPHKHV